LRHFLQAFVGAETLPLIAPTGAVADPPPSDREAVQVVPKGLRSFDARDADFFLSLLPGPRDRDGLPEGVRTWKARIEDRDDPFAVGLIYGPSGCGKSSLVKAGLLPRLAGDVTVVYVEATAARTEARLLNGLRKRFPGLGADVELPRAVAALRAGHHLPAGGKVLVVLDQFEQWLHAHPEPHTDLVKALRHCDGARVQCLVLVRDDFWLPVSRFMSELEVDLVPNRNVALVDLFDPDHARRVLTAFGRAYGKLPQKTADLARDQSAFLDQAVAGLARDGKVICVRLAVFADMMKGRPWTPAGLAEVGGTEGIGVSFLDDTFSSPAANPQHRRHQAAARGVLRALLPDAGDDIKGNMRSESELRAAAGGPPAEFGDLIRALDSDVRLITPTDPAGADRPEAAGERYYQLTHDYLVRPLRDWLTRKQRETRRGRAELRLAERAADWARRPETRALPSPSEWVGTRLFTRRRAWTDSQRRMMRAADRYYLGRGLMVAVFLGLIGWGLARWTGEMRTDYYRDRLLTANVDEVPALLDEMGPYRDPVEARLRAHPPADDRGRLRAALALVDSDPGQTDYLCEQMLVAEPADFATLRDVLARHPDRVRDRLRAAAAGSDRGIKFRALCALGTCAPADVDWPAERGFVVTFLVAQTSLDRSIWVKGVAPLRDRMLVALATAVEAAPGDGRRFRDLVELYRGFAGPNPPAEVWQPLLSRLPPPPPAAALAALLAPPAAEARPAANVAAALIALGRGDAAWGHLTHTADPTGRSLLIERLPAAGAEPSVLWARLAAKPAASQQRALILALGSYPPELFPGEIATLLAAYRTDPDPGVHGAVRWALDRWHLGDRARRIDGELATGRPEGDRRWLVSRDGRTFSIIDLPANGRAAPNGRRLAVGVTEETEAAVAAAGVARPKRFRPPAGPDMPATDLSWDLVADYCNRVTLAEGLGRDECCYRRTGERFEPEPDAESRAGYRMPTEAEWDYLCRAGAATGWAFGEAPELVNLYGNWIGNPLGGGPDPTPVGTFRPNDFGLFDMHGNLNEWCHAFEGKNPGGFEGPISAYRGGAFSTPLLGTRVSSRLYLPRNVTRPHLGFRLVRTLRP